jgi:hypothetical protein
MVGVMHTIQAKPKAKCSLFWRYSVTNFYFLIPCIILNTIFRVSPVYPRDIRIRENHALFALRSLCVAALNEIEIVFLGLKCFLYAIPTRWARECRDF